MNVTTNSAERQDETKPLVVDAHAYFGPQLHYQEALCPAQDAGQFVRLLDETGIDVAVISPPDWVSARANETPPYEESTRAVLEAAEAHPDRLVPLVRVNPNWRDQSVAAFKAWARHPACRGIKLHSQWDYFPVNSKTLVDPLLAICEEHGLSALFSTGTYPAAQPMMFMDLAQRWPNVKIGLVHAGLRFMHDAVIVAQRCPNIALICTPRVAASTMQTAIREVGPERVMFGSDLPLEDPQYSLQTVRSLPGLSAADRNLVLGTSAARWLGLNMATKA